MTDTDHTDPGRTLRRLGVPDHLDACNDMIAEIDATSVKERITTQQN
jgi:hypothetical protein